MPQPTNTGASLLTSQSDQLGLKRSRARFTVAKLGFATAFALVSVKLVVFGIQTSDGFTGAIARDMGTSLRRPDIVDRHGEILATDIQAASLYADPRRIVDIDDTVEQLASVLNQLDTRKVRRRLAGGGRFVWIKRELTPTQQAEIHELGLAGIGFITEHHRVYPAGATAAHVLGYVDVDNRGLAGVERHIDHTAFMLNAKRRRVEVERPAVKLSIDLGVQHAMRSELADAVERYQAKAAAGVVIDVHSGEVVAMSSLPDFDPNRRNQVGGKERFNRLTAGAFELGSVFKLFTTAAALDSGIVSMEQGYDATQPIRSASYTISDYHPKKRWLSIPEIFIYSSNIGTAKMALDLGAERLRTFLERLGLLTRVRTELGYTARPLVPRKWRPVNTMTISYGHGVSVTPLQLASATATLVNGGYKVEPTFFKRTAAETRIGSERVLDRKTSRQLNYLMRLNVKRGTGKRADATGYRVGGKTGTAEKVIDGRYSKQALLSSFVAAFPADEPQYVVYVILDEPQRVAETNGFATAGVNAAPTTGRLVNRIAPMLGVKPVLEVQPSFDELRRASY